MIKTVQAEAAQTEVTSTGGEIYQGIHEWTLSFKKSLCAKYIYQLSLFQKDKKKRKLSKSLNKLK